jgi:hypothetical protein
MTSYSWVEFAERFEAPYCCHLQVPGNATGAMTKKQQFYCPRYLHFIVNNNIHVRLEVFTAVTMQNGVFWDVMPRGSCKNRRFGGT